MVGFFSFFFMMIRFDQTFHLMLSFFFFFVILQDWHLSFLIEINWIFLDDKVGKLGASWLQGWPKDSSWWQGWPSHFFETFLTVRFISSSSHSRVTTMILCYYQLNDSFFSPILLDFFEDFPVTNKKYVCNALRLDDMYASLPDLKYRSPLLWCSILVGCLCLLSKSLLYSFHVLAHSCASHPFHYKRNAYHRLSSMIIGFTVY